MSWRWHLVCNLFILLPSGFTTPTDLWFQCPLNDLTSVSTGTGLCGGQQPTDARFQVAPLNPTSPDQVHI